ncbi:LOW QUALITY PROTEIN: uncharacterized protein [Amphiura filiformis]|uniref:LOW QUALITY PROTEIN: uncharacterized protein n=1 Tax=Amphiura filiformis TaxID=82378 RepID=UPI003B213831
MKKVNRSSLAGRPGMPRSSSLDSLGMDSKKLEEDIAVMESTLHQHRNKMMQQDLDIRTQISKATGSSRWISGGKGQLKGYKSHKDLQSKDGNPSGSNTRPRKSRPTSGKHAQQKAKDHGKLENMGSNNMIQEYGTHRVKQKYSNTRNYQQCEKDIHADEIHPTSKHHRSSGNNQGILSVGQKKEGTVRRVSFDLSDEDEMEEDKGQVTDSWKNGSGLHIPLHNLDRHTAENPADVNSDRIATLKAKVIAKASANIQPETVKTKVKPKTGLQPKKAKKGVSTKTHQYRKDGRSIGTNISAHHKSIQLEASGTEVHKVSKVKPKPKNEKQGIEDEAVHTYIKWEGYDSADDDQFDQKSSSQSSSDVFLSEPAANVSKPDAIQRKLAVEHDPAVTAWLYSLNLLDPEKYSQIFHSHNMTMESVLYLTETQLKTMGVTSFVALKKILDGIKALSGEEKSRTNTHKMSTSLRASHTQSVQSILDTKPITKPSTTKTQTNESGEVGTTKEQSFSMFDDLPHDDEEINMYSEDLHVTGRSTNKLGLPDGRDEDTPKKKKGPVLTSGVVNRTLASGVHAATNKLKNKQEQELQEQKRQEKLKRAKKAERDRMARQHAQRIKEREERERREEEEGVVGYDEETSDSVSPQASQTVDMNDLMIHSQGLHTGEKRSTRPSSGRTSNRMADHAAHEASESYSELALSSPEQRLQDLELQIRGLQGVPNQTSSETEAKLEKIQQQLNALQIHLRPNSAIHVPKSDGDVAAAKAQKKRAESAPMGKGHRRTRTKSLSKQDLLKEVKKQKEKHRKEIKMLESELSRLKYRDPVQSCELPEEDIIFDETAVLGEGTFSQVFSGNFNGSEVAIKRLKIPIQEADHNYFAEEVSLLHELRHPRVVLLLGVCTTGRLPLMVLEYMAGGSLYHYLHDSDRPSLDHVGYYQIARDICLGMNYLHRHRPVVLHLDLKPMNVLLGTYGRAKIADFGFSKLRHEAGSGKVRGTPAWMAPELLENATELTPKVDVYSFAIILWEMLTRDSPYEGLSVFQVLERVRRNKRLEIPSSCPEPLRRLICACWEHKPNKRPSFKDILISLEGLSFPPEWKALLNAAGIPRETMEDPTSARNIISLVNQSMHMSQKQLDQMALESHTQLMKACHMDIPEAVEEASGDHDNLGVVDSVEDVGSIPLGGMEDSGYDDDTGLLKHSARGALSSRRAGFNTVRSTQPAIPQAPPPPAIALHHTNPTPSALMVQSKTLRKTSTKTKQHGALNSPGGLAQFQLDAAALTNQREKLRTTTRGPHPSQLADLGIAPETKLISIADILKKAVNSRHVALKEDLQSKEELHPDSMWSMDSPR